MVHYQCCSHRFALWGKYDLEVRPSRLVILHLTAFNSAELNTCQDTKLACVRLVYMYVYLEVLQIRET